MSIRTVMIERLGAVFINLGVPSSAPLFLLGACLMLYYLSNAQPAQQGIIAPTWVYDSVLVGFNRHAADMRGAETSWRNKTPTFDGENVDWLGYRKPSGVVKEA